jgi:Ca-activated chloride channel homolog
LLFVGLGLILASIGAFFLLPKAKRTRPKNLISLGLHIVISITLALAFSNIKFLTTSSDVEVYAVVDVSDSESQNADKLTELVQDVYKQAGSKNAKVGVVAYGKNQTTIAKAGSRMSSDAIKNLFDENNTTIDRSASDIASALTYTNNLFSDNVVRRMVLISDGIETDGSAIDTIETLKNNDVVLDSVLVSDSLKHEVAITGIEYTDRVFLGRTEQVKISVRATRATNGKVKLTCGGTTIDSSDVTIDIAKGLNVYTYTLPTDKAGQFDYEVTLDADSDTFDQNNIKRFTQYVTEDYKFLYLSGNTADDEKYVLDNLGIYNDSSKVTYYFDDYDHVPYKMEDLVKYDEIILSDFNVTHLDDNVNTEIEESHAQQFVANIKSAVSVYGKSLLTFGDTHTGLSNENYSYLSELGDILPVQSHSEGGKAIIFLIDVSGSMESDNRLKMAKKGVQEALETLSDDDMVGVTSFSDDVEIVKPLTSMKNKDEIVRAVNKMQTQGGTTMGPGLKMAGKQLKESNAEFKTVITLSDGDPFDTESSLKKIVRNLAEDNITFSFINISNKSGESLLKHLAAAGNGNYYYIKNANQLADMMANSVSEEITNIAIKQEDTTVVVRNSEDEVLKGTNSDFAYLSGFNYCRIKSQATTVLTSTYIKSSETIDEDTGTSSETTTTYNVPLYAYWSYGKGTVSSFTADLIGSTTSSFRSSAGGKQFFKNIMTTTLPTRSASNLLDFSYVNYGYTSTISVNPNNGDYTGKITVKVSDPDNNVNEYELVYNGTSYSVSIPVGKTGTYNVEINYYESNNGNVSSELTASDTEPLYFDYSKEYNFFDTDSTSDIMYRLAKNLSGSTTTGRVDYNTSDAEYQYSSYYSTMMIFLLISVALFLVDIFVRKSDIIFRKKKPSENAAINQ